MNELKVSQPTETNSSKKQSLQDPKPIPINAICEMIKQIAFSSKFLNLEKLCNDALNVVTDVSCHGESGAVADRERNVQAVSDRLCQQRLAGTGRTEHHYVRLLKSKKKNFLVLLWADQSTSEFLLEVMIHVTSCLHGFSCNFFFTLFFL